MVVRCKCVFPPYLPSWWVDTSFTLHYTWEPETSYISCYRKWRSSCVPSFVFLSFFSFFLAAQVVIGKFFSYQLPAMGHHERRNGNLKKIVIVIDFHFVENRSYQQFFLVSSENINISIYIYLYLYLYTYASDRNFCVWSSALSVCLPSFPPRPLQTRIDACREQWVRCWVAVGWTSWLNFFGKLEIVLYSLMKWCRLKFHTCI